MRGGKIIGAGRKPGSKNINRLTEYREVIKQVRWTFEEWQKVYKAACKTGETPSKFVRIASLERANSEDLEP